MKFLFYSYVCSTEFSKPEDWLERIKGYVIMLESLAIKHQVISIEQINFTADLQFRGVQYLFRKFEHPSILPTALHRLIKNQRPDVIVLHGLDYPLQLLQLKLSLGSGPIILVQSHAEKLSTGVKGWTQRLADKVIDGYLFSSNTLADKWILNKLISDRKKIREVMVASSIFKLMDKQTAREISGISGDLNFLWVGRLDSNKDPLTTIRAFIRYLETEPSARLYMVYQSEELISEVHNIINGTSKKDSIILLGKLPHHELQCWYNSADFYISSSRAEAFGVAVTESMSCSCIPILSRIPSHEKITSNSCGLLFEAGNEDELLSALLKVSSLNREVEQKKVLHQYDSCLSPNAIAGQIEAAATSL